MDHVIIPNPQIAQPMSKISNERLNHIATRPKVDVDNLKAGEQLALQGHAIEQLLTVVTARRLELAARLGQDARKLLSSRQFRSAVSRAYYSEYHTMRAVVYFATPGDDHEAHSVLPKNIPKDFPEREDWDMRMKNARLDRNRADYDAFPAKETAFADVAQRLCDESRKLLRIARKYLRSKGCAL